MSGAVLRNTIKLKLKINTESEKKYNLRAYFFNFEKFIFNEVLESFAKMIYILGLLLVNFFPVVLSMDFGNDPTTVEAVAGDIAAIPCSVSNPLADDQASLILWYRVDKPNPIYTLDIRNVPFKGAIHFPSPEMGLRANFNLSVHPPVLLLNPVLEEDTSEYKCRVDLRRSRTLILHSRLRVIVPPSDPIIMDEHGQHLYDVIGPYDEGANLTFICEVDGGNPSPNVTWWSGTTLLDDDFNVTTQGFVRNEMFLHKIQRSDLMQEYTCRAENTPLLNPKEATVQVDINLLPLEARIILPKAILIAEEEHEIFCETKGSRPRALTTWWLEGQKIGLGTPEGLLEGSNDTLSTLHFTPKPSDDGKYLTCKSINPSLPTTMVKDEVALKVQFIPLVNISFGANITPSAINEGSDVLLESTIWANPWISSITWQFENKNLTTNKKTGIFINNQTLLLHNVNKDNRGKYRVIAKNTVGEGRSKYLRMYVKFTPVCRSNDPKIYGIATQEVLNVTCDFEADPRDTQIRWSINNSHGIQILTNWTNAGPKSVFSYSPKTEEGYGILMCWVKNGIGIQRDPCIIKVVPAGAPDAPHDCFVINQTSQDLIVECEPGYNGSLPQTFHMEVYDSIMEHMTENLTNADKPSFKAPDLTPGTSYVLVIYASNVKGKSNPVALVGTTLLPAEKRTAEDDSTPLSPIMVILLGVLLLFVMSCLIVLILVRIHTNQETRKNKDTIKQTETISCDIPKKDLEESQDASERGPDIIPMSKDSEVFYMSKVSEDPMFDIKPDEPPTEYVHEKYTDTVL